MTDATHANACHTWGPEHYDCARRRIDILEGLLREIRRAVTQANVEISMQADAYGELPECSLAEFIGSVLEPAGDLKCMST